LNGEESQKRFVVTTALGYCKNSSITHVRIQKGKPNQNGFIERFNRTYREDVLDANIFERISQVRDLTNDWMEDYNYNHPHASLGNMSPIEFMNTKTKRNLSNLAL